MMRHFQHPLTNACKDLLQWVLGLNEKYEVMDIDTFKTGEITCTLLIYKSDRMKWN